MVLGAERNPLVNRNSQPFKIDSGSNDGFARRSSPSCVSDGRSTTCENQAVDKDNLMNE